MLLRSGSGASLSEAGDVCMQNRMALKERELKAAKAKLSYRNSVAVDGARAEFEAEPRADAKAAAQEAVQAQLQDLQGQVWAHASDRCRAA